MNREVFDQPRALIAQAAARMMVEDSISDFAYAKKKASRELGYGDNSTLPTNAEVEEEIKIFHQLFYAEEQPLALNKLRKAALMTMELFERFNPYLTGGVLEGTAGKNSQTDIHLFADSAKEVEIFLLSQHIPFEASEKTHRLSDKPSKDKKDKVRKTVPMYTLETEYGLQKLSVFEYDDMRVHTKKASDGNTSDRLNTAGLKKLLSNTQ